MPKEIFCVLKITYSRVPNKSVGGNFFLKSDKTGEDLLNKKFQIRTFRRENPPKKNKISSRLRNSRMTVIGNLSNFDFQSHFNLF